VRRCRDLISELTTALVEVTPQEQMIIRRIAVLACELEQRELVFATTGSASNEDLEVYNRTAGGMRRLLESIGLERRQKELNRPSLPQILEAYAKRGEQREATP
jgi:hypothetical protein